MPATTGAATPGSRRVKLIRAELPRQPKGLLPEKVALTMKAARTTRDVHEVPTAFGAPDITEA
jgi:hypothetical protein